MNFKVHLSKYDIEKVINKEWIEEFKKFSEEIEKFKEELGEDLIKVMKKVTFVTTEEKKSSFYQKRKNIYLHPKILNLIKE